MSAVREQAKATEEEIQSCIEHLVAAATAMLRERGAVLICDLETIKYQKEKELGPRKEELESLLSGIRGGSPAGGCSLGRGDQESREPPL